MKKKTEENANFFHLNTNIVWAFEKNTSVQHYSAKGKNLWWSWRSTGGVRTKTAHNIL